MTTYADIHKLTVDIFDRMFPGWDTPTEARVRNETINKVSEAVFGKRPSGEPRAGYIEDMIKTEVLTIISSVTILFPYKDYCTRIKESSPNLPSYIINDRAQAELRQDIERCVCEAAESPTVTKAITEIAGYIDDITTLNSFAEGCRKKTVDAIVNRLIKEAAGGYLISDMSAIKSTCIETARKAGCAIKAAASEEREANDHEHNRPQQG